MEHFAVDFLFPEFKIWEQYSVDAFGDALRLDSLRSSHPIIVPIIHAEEVDQVFDAISYRKGSVVVKMISTIIGDDKFREGLQIYMQKHAYGNTETEDLWKVWSEVSGKDIGKIMSTWTKVTGYPYITITSETWTSEEILITLEQSRFISDGSEESLDYPLWSIPLIFETSDMISGSAVIMDKKRQTFSIKIKKSTENNWLKINAGQKALIRVVHSPNLITKLTLAIKNNQLKPIDRAALLLDSYALVKAGLAPLEDLVYILKSLDNEDNHIVWGAIQSILSGLYNLMEQTENKSVFDSFVKFGKTLIVKVLKRIGWDGKKNEVHTDKLLRSTIFSLLHHFAWDDIDVVTEARRRFDLHFTNPLILPNEYKTTVYKIVLMNGGIKEYESILKTFRDTNDNQEKKYALYSLGSSLDLNLKKRTLDWAVKSGEVKLQDFFYGIGAVASNLEGSLLCWKYLKDNFQLIKSMLLNASPSLMDATIVNSVHQFCTIEKADEIQSFFEINPLPNSVRRISQLLEAMRANGNMLNKIKKSNLSEESFWN